MMMMMMMMMIFQKLSNIKKKGFGFKVRVSNDE